MWLIKTPLFEVSVQDRYWFKQGFSYISYWKEVSLRGHLIKYWKEVGLVVEAREVWIKQSPWEGSLSFLSLREREERLIKWVNSVVKTFFHANDAWNLFEAYTSRLSSRRGIPAKGNSLVPFIRVLCHRFYRLWTSNNLSFHYYLHLDM